MAAGEGVVGAVGEFERERGRLFGLAYRLLGSAEEAEDAVQDAYLRWAGAERAAIGSPPRWLAKVVTNLCLNRLTSARATRERYVGPWLPEPVLTGDGTLGPLESAEQRESVSLAMLVLLERLTPAERAVFVLREAFGYGHRDVAEVMELSEANCRQLHRRARQRVEAARAEAGRGRFRADPAKAAELVERFLSAARDGDLPGLERLLAEGVTSWADGGGVERAARRPISGRLRVARYLAGVAGRFGAGVRVAFAEVNGEPAVLAHAGGTLIGVLVAEVAGDRIQALHTVANPVKLRFLARQAAGLSHPEGPAGS
ncbi:MAG: RNA polymerase sigma-70 factor [Mycobacteriales bacterium]